MFHYLRAIDHNLADGKKQDAGTAVAHPAETWMSVSCGRVTDGRWVQMWHKCSGFVLAPIKVEQKHCHTQKQIKAILTRAESVFKKALDLGIISHFYYHSKLSLKTIRLGIEKHPKLKEKIGGKIWKVIRNELTTTTTKKVKQLFLCENYLHS